MTSVVYTEEEGKEVKGEKMGTTKGRTKKEVVSVGCKDLYQMLIESCRYGYTRNNHLMPDGAFEHCRTYLPRLKRVWGEHADHVAKQLAEEAIGQLIMDAFDDDSKKFSFFQEGIQGADREIKAEWTRGLYRFAITYEFNAAPGVKFFTEDGTTYLETVSAGDGKVELRFLAFESDPHKFETVVYQRDKTKPGWYISVMKWHTPVIVDEGEQLVFSAQRGEEHLNIKNYISFIDFCLDFMGDGVVPYNMESYREYLIRHPKS